MKSKKDNDIPVWHRFTVSPSEAADLIGSHVQTVAKLIKGGQIKAFRIGTRVHIRTADLRAWVDQLAERGAELKCQRIK